MESGDLRLSQVSQADPAMENLNTAIGANSGVKVTQPDCVILIGPESCAKVMIEEGRASDVELESSGN